MKRWFFLSVPPLPWVMSLGTHFTFILILLWLGRSHFRDLNLVSLDFAPAKSIALYQPPKEEYWQKPMLKRIARLPIPKPKIEPTPQPAAVQVAPAAGQGNGPVRSLAEVTQSPHFMTQVKPLYPEAAKRAGIEGVVILKVNIDATGLVKKVEVLRGLGYGCDEAAVAAMQQSTLTPAYVGSEPVEVNVPMTYRFKIDQ